ncbi:MAG: gamma-glutamyltransferase family protein [Burkholderiales bacterium]|nr:gamma-glutamyltransferase family protein [Burkholderiales bacterium]
MNPPFTTRPEMRGSFGVAASTHWIASAVAMRMLELGGNAFDGAVAGGLALQVLEPHLCGPGGEVPILLWNEAASECKVICGQGVAPQAATIAHFRAMGLHMVPGTGLLSATVPGAFDAWMLLLRDHGSLPLRTVLEPVIGYATRGVPLVPRIRQAIAAVKDLFLAEWPASAATYLPGGAVPGANHLLVNAGIAATYTRVLAEAEAAGSDRVRQIDAARNAWYRGFVAEAIGAYCRSTPSIDTTGERHRGLLDADDLARWQAAYDAPLLYAYAGVEVAKCGAWSQGPVLHQQLALLAGFDLARMGHNSAAFVHTLVEASKLAMADRDAWYGDPDFQDVPLADLLSTDYARERRALIGEASSTTLRAGAPGGRQPRLIDWESAQADVRRDRFFHGLGEPTFAELPAGNGVLNGDTCHIDVIDRFGNMVSATPSGGWLSSSPVIPGLGFALNTRGQMFTLEAGHPAALAPGKRPRTSLSPGMAFRDGLPWAVFGTPGGDNQDQWQVQLLVRLLHFGMNLQEAIDAPAWHSSHLIASFWPRRPQLNSLTLEGRFDAQVIAELRERGHAVTVGEPWSEGRLSAASREPAGAGRLLRAAANPRGMQGYAIGR